MLELSIIVSLCVLFLHVCTWEGMIFSCVPSACWNWPSWLRKPIYECPVCMSIWWGPLFLAIGIKGEVWEITNFYQLILILSAAAALNAVLIQIISTKAITNGSDSTGSDSQ